MLFKSLLKTIIITHRYIPWLVVTWLSRVNFPIYMPLPIVSLKSTTLCYSGVSSSHTTSLLIVMLSLRVLIISAKAGNCKYYDNSKTKKEEQWLHFMLQASYLATLGYPIYLTNFFLINLGQILGKLSLQYV